MNKTLWLIGIIVALGISASVQAADQPKEKPQQPPGTPAVPPGVHVYRDLEYVVGGHARNKLDLYLGASRS